jgi:hypothetical protein
MENALKHNHEPFLVRAKSLDPENADKEKQISGNLIVQSTRGQVFKLAPAVGEFLEPSKASQQYDYLLRVQEGEDGGFKLLNIVSGQGLHDSNQPTEKAQEMYKK